MIKPFTICQSTPGSKTKCIQGKQQRCHSATRAQAPDVHLGSTDSVVGKLEEALAARSLSSLDEADVRFATAPPPRGLAERILNSDPVLSYLSNLERHPLATKCWTSFTGFFLGDVIAQMLQGDGFDITRTLILAAYGYIIDAPAGNAFYNWLDANIDPNNGKTAAAVGKKIAIDQLVYAPIFTCVLFTYLQLAHGDVAGIPAALQAKVVPTLMANYTVWPAMHALNFYYVPTEQRILYNNIVAVCWTTWLSCLAN